MVSPVLKGEGHGSCSQPAKFLTTIPPKPHLADGGEQILRTDPYSPHPRDRTSMIYSLRGLDELTSCFCDCDLKYGLKDKTLSNHFPFSQISHGQRALAHEAPVCYPFKNTSGA